MTGAIRLAHFLEARARETYAEPANSGHDVIIKQVAPKIAEMLPKGGRILDVGSGPGVALEWFSGAGFDVTGIDVNAENIAAAKERGFTVLNCDMHDLGRWCGIFDCVWARHVLEHSIAPYFALSEFFNALKPGGILYAEVPLPDSPCRHETNVNHYSVLGEKMWVNLFLKTGFLYIGAVSITGMSPVGGEKYLGFTWRKS